MKNWIQQNYKRKNLNELVLGHLQYQDVGFTWSDDAQLFEFFLISREPKENQWKIAKVEHANQVDDVDCVVRILNFKDRTSNMRVNLPKNCTLFLAEIEK